MLPFTFRNVYNVLHSLKFHLVCYQTLNSTPNIKCSFTSFTSFTSCLLYQSSCFPFRLLSQNGLATHLTTSTLPHHFTTSLVLPSLPSFAVRPASVSTLSSLHWRLLLVAQACLEEPANRALWRAITCTRSEPVGSDLQGSTGRVKAIHMGVGNRKQLCVTYFVSRTESELGADPRLDEKVF